MEDIWSTIFFGFGSVFITMVIGTIIGGMIMSYFNIRSRRKEKKEDYARQDEVANKLTKRQDMIASKAAEAAELLLAANERVAASAVSTNNKLDVIHTLVNSNMTAAMQSEHDAVVRELAMMREVLDLKSANGLEPSTESLTAIEQTQSKVDELRANLKDRLEQTKIADSQIFIAREREQEQPSAISPGFATSTEKNPTHAP